MLYLMFYDDTPKKPAALKIQEAIAAYERRFGHAPNVLWCREAVEGTGLRVEAKTTVQVNNYWLTFDPAAPRLPHSEV